MLTLTSVFGTTVAFNKENVTVFIMPTLGSFIQDFDKYDPQLNINSDTFKILSMKLNLKIFQFEVKIKKSNQFYES